MRISDWSSDVRSSDLHWDPHSRQYALVPLRTNHRHTRITLCSTVVDYTCIDAAQARTDQPLPHERGDRCTGNREARGRRSEEHTSELQSLMRISYAVFCLKKKNKQNKNTTLYKTRHTNE